MSWLSTQNSRFKAAIIFGFIAALWFLRPNTVISTGQANLNSEAKAEITAAQEDLVREAYPEALSIPKGDVKALKSFYQKRLGLVLKEIKQNPDGTYNAVIQGAEPTLYKQASALTTQDQAQYQQQFLQLENKGRSVDINERDRKELAAFRRGVGNL